MYELITETVKGVLTYTITGPTGDKVAGAHRVNAKLNMYSLVIPGNPPTLGQHDAMVQTMRDMVAKANATLTA